MSYILELEENNYGELAVSFPSEITDEMSWKLGDILEWDIKGTGIVLNRLNDPKGYEVQEE
jgi:bifunctional DNA-binding transcriptional regulator/antitoxin component of YhaV-PrlF toxin-antitoxin module